MYRSDEDDAAISQDYERSLLLQATSSRTGTPKTPGTPKTAGTPISRTPTTDKSVVNGAKSPIFERTPIWMTNSPLKAYSSPERLMAVSESRPTPKRNRWFFPVISLMASIVVVVVILSVLFIVSVILNSDAIAGNMECTRTECIVISGKALKTMNINGNACQNIYNFVCGGHANHNVPLHGWSNMLKDNQHKVIMKIEDILQLKVKGRRSCRAQEKAEQFYRSCRNIGTQRMSFLENYIREVNSSIPNFYDYGNRTDTEFGTLLATLQLYLPFRLPLLGIDITRTVNNDDQYILHTNLHLLAPVDLHFANEIKRITGIDFDLSLDQNLASALTDMPDISFDNETVVQDQYMKTLLRSGYTGSEIISGITQPQLNSLLNEVDIRDAIVMRLLYYVYNTYQRKVAKAHSFCVMTTIKYFFMPLKESYYDEFVKHRIMQYESDDKIRDNVFNAVKRLIRETQLGDVMKTKILEGINKADIKFLEPLDSGAIDRMYQLFTDSINQTGLFMNIKNLNTFMIKAKNNGYDVEDDDIEIGVLNDFMQLPFLSKPGDMPTDYARFGMLVGLMYGRAVAKLANTQLDSTFLSSKITIPDEHKQELVAQYIGYMAAMKAYSPENQALIVPGFKRFDRNLTFLTLSAQTFCVSTRDDSNRNRPAFEGVHYYWRFNVIPQVYECDDDTDEFKMAFR